MKFHTKPTEILRLQDGITFDDSSSALKGTHRGSICFANGMTGYQEIYTDSRNYGQVMVYTTTHLINYGSPEI